MNDRKIAFIICSNDELYFNEAKFYIESLHIPFGYEVDLLMIKDATSMSSGYNEAMHISDAKYKVYLHQDVFIIDPLFLEELLQIFKDPDIGLVGVAGCKNMPSNATFAACWDTRCTYICDSENTTLLCDGFSDNDVEFVNAIDGMLMATQYDLEWDETFDAWDYYDISQSIRFQESNYKIAVAKSQNGTAWALHDEGYCVPRDYDKYRKIFCEKYSKYGFQHDDSFKNRDAIISEFDQAKSPILEAFKKGAFNIAEVHSKIEFLNQMGVIDTDLSIINQLLKINKIGDKSFWPNVNLTKSFQLYHQIKFAIWRIELGLPENESFPLIQLMKDNKLSLETIAIITSHYAFDVKRTLKSLGVT